MGPQLSTQLAGTLGIKKQTASQLIPSVLPLIMGGMKRAKPPPADAVGAVPGDT